MADTRTIKQLIDDEPIAAVFGTSAAVVATVNLLQTFGVAIDASQASAITTWWTMVVTPFAIAWARKRSKPTRPDPAP